MLQLNVCHLKQGKVIFEGESLEVVKRKITFHCQAKILNGPTELI
jgi:hypothetical protein